MIERLKNELTIQRGTLKEYKVLEDFCYLNTSIPLCKYVYTVRPKPLDPRTHCRGFSGPAGGHASLIAVIIYSMPMRDLKARTTATAGFFKQTSSLSERLHLLNKHVLYVSRLVVDPRYRQLGIADWLWRETLKVQTVSMVESLTPLPVREDWLKSMGFRIYYSPTPQSLRKLKKAFAKAHLTGSCLTVAEVAQKRINALASDKMVKLDRSLHHFLSNYKSHEHDTNSLERTRYILSKLPYPNGYLVWFNTHIDDNPVLDWVTARKVKQNFPADYVPIAEIA